MFCFLPKLTKLTTARESAAFGATLLVSFIALVSFSARLVSFGGESARSNVQKIAPHPLDRAAHRVRAPRRVTRREQPLLSQPFP